MDGYGMDARLKMKYTPRQGQCLAVIYYYTKLNGEPPSELDIACYFEITAPAAHRMVVTLQERGFIKHARKPTSLLVG